VHANWFFPPGRLLGDLGGLDVLHGQITVDHAVGLGALGPVSEDRFAGLAKLDALAGAKRVGIGGHGPDKPTPRPILAIQALVASSNPVFVGLISLRTSSREFILSLIFVTASVRYTSVSSASIWQKKSLFSRSGSVQWCKSLRVTWVTPDIRLPANA
jgi:hypothetical protein